MSNDKNTTNIDLRNTNWLQSMADCVSSAITIKDLDHKYALVNQFFADSTGLKKEEIIGKNDIDIGIPAELVLGTDQSTGLWKLDDEAVASGDYLAIDESLVEHQSGEQRRIRTIRCPLRDSEGLTSHLLTMTSDITHHGGIAQEEFLQTILETNPDLISAEDSDLTNQRSTFRLLHKDRELLARRNAFHSSLSSLASEKETRKQYIPLLQRISEEILALLGADSSYISVVHESKDYLQTVAAAGDSPTSIGYRHLTGEGIAGRAWKEGTIQVVDDYYKYDNKISGFENIKQVCALPIKVDGDVVVVIGIVYLSVNEKLLERAGELEEFAQQVTIVIENAKLIESARADLARTEALYKLSGALYESYDTQTVLDMACEVVVDVCDAELVQICRKSHDSKLSVDAEKYATDCTPDKKNHRCISNFDATGAFKTYLTHKCFASQAPVTCSRNNTNSDATEASSILKAREQHDIGSIICVPLVNDGRVWGALLAYRNYSKPDFTDTDSNLLSAIGSQASVAVHKQKLLSKVEHQAYHDSLTELPNRLKFEQSLSKAVDRAKNAHQRLAVLFIDLDGFKVVNDVFGHSIGDELLRSVADRLRSIFDSSDLLCRMGGDEFAVLLQDVQSLVEVIEIAERTIVQLAPQYVVEGVTVSVGASIGISLFPDDSGSAANLLKNADIAMYQAKDKGKNCARYFDIKMARKFKERVETEKELGDAIANHELELVYQPKVSYTNKSVTGVEALLRWNHPTRGYISPIEFIPIAEESGLIIPIGDWVLQEACKQLVEWHKVGHDKLSVAVNVSLQQFSTDRFVEVVQQALQSTGMDANFLDIELTESVVLVEVERTVAKLLTLKDMGVSVSLDDFGTGFSSLRYLQDLPLDHLKIDRSFIEKLDVTDPDLSLVNTIIRMAESFGLDTVAEGVESAEQLRKVVGLGCDCIQGYYFSPPVKPEILLDTINTIEAGLFPGQLAA